MKKNKLLQFLYLLIKPFGYMFLIILSLSSPLYLPPDMGGIALVMIPFMLILISCLICQISPDNFQWILIIFAVLFLSLISIFIVPFILTITKGNLLFIIILLSSFLYIIFYILNKLHAEKIFYILFIFIYFILFFSSI